MKYITYENVLGTYRSRQAGIKALSKHESWFPLKLCPRVAGIVADLMADGHLQHPEMWRMDFCSASLEELERFNQEIGDLFNFSGYVRPCTTNRYGTTYLLAVSCKPLGRVMSLCGVPHGSKVLTKFSIPDWILEDKECFRRFVQRLFDCEGTVDTYSLAVNICMWKESSIIENGKQFFESIKHGLLKHFNIISTNVFLTGRNKRKDGKETIGVNLKIRRMAEVVNFFNKIGFETKKKQETLKRVVDIIINKNKGGAAGI